MNLKKRLFTLLFAFAFAITAFAQGEEAPENWFNLDIENDKVFGVSTERAYNDLLKGKESKTVIVAVIDDGIDFKHEDLKNVMWVNTKEIPGNKIDDDNNGYVDDVHGWNFIGGKDGRNVKEDTYEVTRLFAYFSKKFAEVDVKKLSKEDKELHDYFINKVKPAFLEKYYENNRTYKRILGIFTAIEDIEGKMDGEVTVEKLKKYKAATKDEEMAANNLKVFLAMGMGVEDVKDQFEATLEHYRQQVEKSFNPDFNPRDIVGDNYEDATERNYGNNDFLGPKGDHGSHVAGIIGGSRNNDMGIKGVADNVRIMVVRVVPDGDERDKDVANGIRYAVDNGATVINMSFGKAFTFNKTAVDDAVRYAESKDVLLVHAAGNEALDIDVNIHYPTDTYLKKGAAKNWIEVGACSWKNDSTLTAEFSNYGKKNVDVFAPGVEIKSTTPGNQYQLFSGTSMASPVTAGVCALIRSYFPTLTAEQVKEVILKSVTPVTTEIFIPGTDKKVKMKDLCVTGGVVNAYKATQLAMKTKGKKK